MNSFSNNKAVCLLVNRPQVRTLKCWKQGEHSPLCGWQWLLHVLYPQIVWGDSWELNILQTQQICSLLVSYLFVKINKKTMKDVIFVYNLTSIHYFNSYNPYKSRTQFLEILFVVWLDFHASTESFKVGPGAHAWDIVIGSLFFFWLFLCPASLTLWV